MLTQIQSDLEGFKFSYLPNDASISTKSDPSVQELRAMLTANRAHLRESLIPQLKKIEATIETRDIWAGLVEKNRVQNEKAVNDAAEMQSLLRSQL